MPAADAALATARDAAAQAAAAAARSRNSLQRSLQTIQGLDAAQAAARNQAMQGTSPVPNGLTPGGLEVAPSNDPNFAWQGAGQPNEAVSGGRSQVSIKQTQQKAILSWKTFNVGRETDLTFLQQGSDWVALNRVLDPSAQPSKILGTINAPGQVYVINRNGVIFGGSSQVNVNTLIASSLDIGNDRYFAGLIPATGQNGDEVPPVAFSGVDPVSGVSYSPGKVQVQAGAQVFAPSGRVLLLAPQVENNGDIETPFGQTILAGGYQVWLAQGQQYIRGLDVYVGCRKSAGICTTFNESATNRGVISASQGNVTIVSRDVAQLGAILSTTSTAYNGSILLSAQLLIPEGPQQDVNNSDSGEGTVTLGQGSLVQILPDADDTSLITDSQQIINSFIGIKGAAVDLAPGAIIQLRGYDTNTDPSFVGGVTINAKRVLLEEDSLIDLAGTADGVASASRNSVKVELLGDNLRNSPVVLDGPLYRQTIYVDATKGTPLADASGWIAFTERSLSERMANGASLTIQGSIPTNGLFPIYPQFKDVGRTELVAKAGSVIDISGGYVTYTPGFVQVSKVVTADGRVISVSSLDALPNLEYAGVYDGTYTVNHSRWGITEVYSNSLGQNGYFDPGYIEGKNAGTLNLGVNAAVLGGTLIASAITGERQLDTGKQSQGGTLNLGGGFSYYSAFPGSYSPTNIVLGATAAALPANFNIGSFPLSGEFSQTTYVPLSWLESGITQANFNAVNNIELKDDTHLTLRPGSSLSATAATIDIGDRASISSPGGSIKLETTGGHTPGFSLPSNFVWPSITVGEGARLSTAGLWGNGLLSPAPAAINGGTISLLSAGDLTTGAGSRIDVSAGAQANASGSIAPGNAGSIVLEAGTGFRPDPSDPTLPSRLPRLTLGGELTGFGVYAGGKRGSGGSFSITSFATDAYILPASAPELGGALWTQPSPNVLDLSTEFFSANGFSSIAVAARGLTLTGGTVLEPVVRSRLASSLLSLPTGTPIEDGTTTVLLPSGIRQPAAIALRSTGGAVAVSTSAALVIEEGAVLRTDPLGKVTLTGDQLAVVSGIVEAPGGRITLQGGTYTSASGLGGNTAGQSVWLTGTGQLLARGTQVAIPMANGLVYQDVLPGGTVTVQSGGPGTVVLAPGSVIDVSGAVGDSTLSGTQSSMSSATSGLSKTAGSYQVASDAGTININAVRTRAIIEGALKAYAGGENARGGTLNVAAYAIQVQQAVSSIVTSALHPGDSLPGGSTQLATNIIAPDVNIVNFDNLSLTANGRDSQTGIPPTGSVVTFAGGTTLSVPGNILIDAAAIGMASGGSATVNAGYFAWTNLLAPSAAGYTFKPTSGAGDLTITASSIDLAGNLSLQGLSDTRFIASGDIRLIGGSPIAIPRSDGSFERYYGGSLNATGNLHFTAAQIYPTTASIFTLNSAKTIDFERFDPDSEAPAAPLSAGGTLQVFARDIVQGGVLRAPLGTIRLGCTTECPAALPNVLNAVSQQADLPVAQTETLTLAEGSLTSVSADGQVIPFGVTQQEGKDWVYPLLDSNQTLFEAPLAKLITLNGKDITTASGAKIDASGGGDLYAYEWIPGGNSSDIFAGPNVYAVLPGVQPALAPFDSLYSGSITPAVGRQVYLDGAPGLPAGYYTLLPGHYALLEGAFRVTLQTSPGASTIAATRGPIVPVAQADGSTLTSGYFATSRIGTTATDEHWSVFQVMPQSVARRYSEILDSRGNTFFTDKAVSKNEVIPRLPQDAGQLIVNAASTLIFQGTGLFTPGANGRGGLADISADQIAVVTTAARDRIAGGNPAALDVLRTGAPDGYPGAGWSPLLLAAEDLNNIGVESLLLGGSRTTQSDGVHVKATASAVVVANDASEPLALPEVLLAATPKSAEQTVPNSSLKLMLPVPGTGQVVIADSAAIIATGAVAPGQATTLILDGGAAPAPLVGTRFKAGQIVDYYKQAGLGQGAFVRVSNGVFAGTVRTNTSYAGLPSGPVTITNDNGQSLGTFTLQTPTDQGKVTIGAGAHLITDPEYGAINLNGYAGVNVSPTAELTTPALELASNKISLGLGDDAPTPNDAGLVLTQSQLARLASLKALALRTSRTIDVYADAVTHEFDLGQSLLGSLTLDAAAIVAKTAGSMQFTADEVTLENTQGGKYTDAASAAGASLTVDATSRIILGPGTTALNGFSAGAGITLSSSGEIVAEGNGALEARGNLVLDAPQITAGSLTVSKGLPKFNQVSYAITASDGGSGFYDIGLQNSHAAAATSPGTYLGNSLTLKGGAVSIATTVALPGGSFAVDATGDINGRAGAVVDAGARSIAFGDVAAAIGGGSITLTSSSGRIAVTSGARLDVNGLEASGALGEAEAGTIALSASSGGVTLASGVLFGKGPSDDKGGSFVLDSAYLDGTSNTVDYDTLAEELVAGGFTKSWDVRVRNGNIAMNGRSRARDITVSADAGSITLASAGLIDAHGATGGKVRLWAGNDLTVAGRINAPGLTVDDSGRGGRVWLGAGGSNADGTLTIASTANIDVRAFREATSVDPETFATGDVTLRAPRTGIDAVNTGGTGINIAPIAGAIAGASSIVVEGFQVYQTSQATLNLTPTQFRDLYLRDAGRFMANESAIRSSVLGGNPSLASVLHVRPGIDIRNNGDILVTGDTLNPVGIDLSGSDQSGDPYNTTGALTGHFGVNKEPIVLTIRAAGGLNFGVCKNTCLTLADFDSNITSLISSGDLVLGSLSDGFSSKAGGLADTTIRGVGASGQAALFDPPATAGFAENSATYRLAAGSDLSAANPLATDRTRVATGGIVVAGLVNARTALFRSNGFLYPDNTFAYFDLGSLIRTGTGDIDIATAGDLTMQGRVSAIYTAGTGNNVNGGYVTDPYTGIMTLQPLSGFTQYAVNSSDGTGTYQRIDPDSFSQVLELPPAAFPVRGGDLTIKVGGSVRGSSSGLIYEIAGMGSQNLLTFGNGNPFSPTFTSTFKQGDGGNPVYYDTSFSNYYYQEDFAQLAWYPLFRYFAGGAGALGGGNVSVKAGGSVSNILLALPTNARGAGPVLTAAPYDPTTGTGLLIQGGGSLSVIAGGDIRGVETYVQQGSTLLKAGGSVVIGGSNAYGSVTTGTGDVTVLARQAISIADRVLPSLQFNPLDSRYGGSTGRRVSGISIAQNASLVGVYTAPSNSGAWVAQYDASMIQVGVLQNTLQGILAAPPDGTVTLSAVGAVTLGIDSRGDTGGGSAWAVTQGILPSHLHVISLQDDVTNNGRFITYPAPDGTVDLLARSSVVLGQGFVLSDADPAIMPTLANYVRALDPVEDRAPLYAGICCDASGLSRGAIFVAGGDASHSILDGEDYTTASAQRSLGQQRMIHGADPTDTTRPLHAGDDQPARIIGLLGDVIQIAPANNPLAFVYLAKAGEVLAGRDITNFALVGQNNRASDITSLMAGRDISYPLDRLASGKIDTRTPKKSIQLGGPGDVLISSGRDTDLGSSTGIVTLGNILNPRLPSATNADNPGQGANITILTGLGNTLPDYAGFLAAFADPASASPLARPLVLYGSNGKKVSIQQEATDNVIAWRYSDGSAVSRDGTTTSGISLKDGEGRPIELDRRQDGTIGLYQEVAGPDGKLAAKPITLVGPGGEELVLRSAGGNIVKLSDSEGNEIRLLDRAHLPITLELASDNSAIRLVRSDGTAFAPNEPLTYAALRDLSAADQTRLLSFYFEKGGATAMELAYQYLQGLPRGARDLQLNRLFFSLIRDSGREHTDPSQTHTDYEKGYVAVDTIGLLSGDNRNYELAYAAIDTYLNGTSETGDFRGVFSTLRTKAGGDITVLTPHGSIDVGVATPPVPIDGKSFYGDAAHLGIVTEQGGTIRMYADGNIAVNQSRVFTLDGGDEVLVSRHHNIDAGRGAKTVQAIQPPLISYDADGNIEITPIGPSSGSGIAVLRTLSTTPLGSIDLVAFEGAVNAGDAGIRVSGDINIAAIQIINAANIQVGGQATGIPTIQAPNIGGLTSASNTAGAASQDAAPPANETHEQPSIIIVEVIGYGGAGDETAPGDEEQKHRHPPGQQGSYNPNSAFQVVGAGPLTEEQKQQLSESERRALGRSR